MSSGTSRPRLSLSALHALPSESRPAADPRRLAQGIVHLGIGGFHRAHQAVCTELAIAATGDHRWGICGVTQRSSAQRDLLASQDGLYSVVVRGPEPPTAHVVGSVRRVLDAASDRPAVIAAIADSATRVVTVTVTERGYRLDPGSGRLRIDDPVVAQDAHGGSPARSLVGRLAEALERRRSDGAGALTIVSCDNLLGNGALLENALADYLTLAGDRFAALRAWLPANTAFPSTMVDRVVPTATDADRRLASDLLGVTDDAAVATEPFFQWVVEDRFAADRPEWEAGGAQLVDDVRPFEVMKLRFLNGSHTAIAYAGLLVGHRTVREAICDPDVRALVVRLMDDMSNVTEIPPGVDLNDYRSTLLRRFENPALSDALERIASDGSQKLGPRLLDAAESMCARGSRSAAIPFVVAAWAVALLRGTDDTGAPIVVNDPLEGLPTDVSSPDAVLAGVGRLLDRPEILPAALRDTREFLREVTQAAERLVRSGTRAALREVVTRDER